MDGDEELVLQIRDLDAEEESNNSSGSSGSSSLGSSGTVETEPLTASTVTMMSMEPISAANVGSLLRFFQSMFFDSWITISYLYKFREHAGVCDYLCNELYKFQEREVEKYIPQLWYTPRPYLKAMALKLPSISLNHKQNRHIFVAHRFNSFSARAASCC